MTVLRSLISILLVMLAGLPAIADDHYRLILRNKTRYAIDVKISSSVDGLDYANIKSIRVAPGDELSQEHRIATYTKDVIVRIDNDYETCTLFSGDYPIAIPSASIYYSEPVTKMEIVSPRNKKYSCVASLQ